MPQREKRVIHSPTAILLNGLPGAGKSGLAIHIQERYHEQTGTKPRIFRIDDYGLPESQDPKYLPKPDDPNFVPLLYPPWLLKKRYKELSEAIRKHLTEKSHEPFIVDSPYNNDDFRKLIGSIIENPRFATYTVGLTANLENRKKRVDEAIREGKERHGSTISPTIVERYGEAHRDELFQPEHVIENNGSESGLKDHAYRMADRVVEETTTNPITSQEIRNTLSGIDRAHQTPQEKLEALMVYLAERYGFKRMGSAQLLLLDYHPAIPGQLCLKQAATRNFFGGKVEKKSTKASYFTLDEENLSVKYWQSSEAGHVEEPNAWAWFHKPTEVELRANVPYSDHMYYPIQFYFPVQSQTRKMDPRAASRPGPEALIGLYSIHRKNPKIFAEIGKFLNHHRVKEWANDQFNTIDQTVEQVQEVQNRIRDIEVNAGTARFSERVARLSAKIAFKMGLNRFQIAQVMESAKLHRMGLLLHETPERIAFTDKEDVLNSRASGQVLPGHSSRDDLIRGATEHPLNVPSRPIFVGQDGSRVSVGNLGILEESSHTDPNPHLYWNAEIRRRYDSDERRQILAGKGVGTLTSSMIKQIGNGLGHLESVTLNHKKSHLYAQIIRVASAVCKKESSLGMEEILTELREGARRGEYDRKVVGAFGNINPRIVNEIRKSQRGS